MLILNIGFGADSVNLNYHAVGLKLSYLLSNQLIMVGDIGMAFNARRFFMRMDTKNKIQFVMSNDASCTPEEMETFRLFIQALKDFNKIKIKTKEQIVQLKLAEKTVDSYFEEAVEKFINYQDIMGMTHLSVFEGHPHLAFYYSPGNNTEAKNKDGDPFSEVLRLDIPEEDLAQPIVMFLNNNLFTSSFQNAYPGMVPRENEKTDAGFITPLLSFNNFNIFSVSDIDIIRSQVNNSLAAFLQAFDAFPNLKAQPGEAFNYLQNELKTAAALLQNELDNCHSIKSYMKNPHFTITSIQLYAGMLPWDTIYKYLVAVDALKDETLAVIEKSPLTGLMPVLIMKANDGDNADPGLMHTMPDENTIPTLRKSLEI